MLGESGAGSGGGSVHRRLMSAVRSLVWQQLGRCHLRAHPPIWGQGAGSVSSPGGSRLCPRVWRGLAQAVSSSRARRAIFGGVIVRNWEKRFSVTEP